jgi:hypothetical protein
MNSTMSKTQDRDGFRSWALQAHNTLVIDRYSVGMFLGLARQVP